MKTQLIKTQKLKNNIGQVEGLPKNPRLIRDGKFLDLKKSIEEDPEMLELREIIAYDNNGELIVICGNMRLQASIELGLKEIPTKILPFETPLGKLKAYVIKDNISYGEHDWNLVANEWEIEDLKNWGLDIPDFDKVDDLEDGEEIEFAQSVQLIPPKEYILILCEPNSEDWEDLKGTLKLAMVRRGGYKKGSAFDAVALERVIEWKEFKKRYNVDSSTEQK